MDNSRKIEILNSLSQVFKGIVEPQFKLPSTLEEYRNKGLELIEETQYHNPWFITDAIKKALRIWGDALEADKVEKWLKGYKNQSKGKKVGVIMAGNIPLVGLHDALVVLASDNYLIAKLSSKDFQLMNFVLNVLSSISEEWKAKIKIGEKLKNIDILIATGSDNSARYFEYYFRDKTKIIRKNRTSVALINGDESTEDLKGLASDVFSYFGLGCRNVTKIFLPKGYNKDLLFEAFFDYKEIINHNKYANNYDYNKAIYLLEKVDLLDNGFLLLKEDKGLHSPVGVLYYEEYKSLDKVYQLLEEQSENIQCIVSKNLKKQHVYFGDTQNVGLWDYADKIDTMKFLDQTH